MNFKKIFKLLLTLSIIFMALQFTPYNAVEMIYHDKERNKQLTEFNQWKKFHEKEYKKIIVIPEKVQEEISFEDKPKIYTSDLKYTHEQVKDYGSDVELFNSLNNLRTNALTGIFVLAFVLFLYARLKKWNGGV